MLILVSALYIESKKIIKKLELKLIERKNKRQQIFLKNNIYLITTGIGWKNLNKMIKYFFKKYNISKNDTIILIGIAGAIDKNLKVGDIIIPGKIQNNNTIIKINKNKEILYDENKIFFKSDKISLAKKYPDVSAVDMESFQFTNLMLKQNIKNYKIIKVISDTVNSHIPNFEDFTKKWYSLKFKKLFHLFLFKYNTNKAIKKLTKYLIRTI